MEADSNDRNVVRAPPLKPARSRQTRPQTQQRMVEPGSPCNDQYHRLERLAHTMPRASAPRHKQTTAQNPNAYLGWAWATYASDTTAPAISLGVLPALPALRAVSTARCGGGRQDKGVISLQRTPCPHGRHLNAQALHRRHTRSFDSYSSQRTPNPLWRAARRGGVAVRVT